MASKDFLGRDLIMYILANGLENKPVFEDGRIIGFMTEKEAAIKYGVCCATVRVWIDMGFLKGFKLDNTFLIPVDSDNPKNITIECC